MLKTSSMEKVYSLFSEENQKHASIYGEVSNSRAMPEKQKKQPYAAKRTSVKSKTEQPTA